MKFKLLNAVILFPLFLVGCEHLQGSLDVSSELALKDKRGKVFNLPPGSYAMEWTQKHLAGKKYIKIELKDASGREHNVRIPIPKDVVVSSNSDSFELKAEEIKQSYDLTGHFNLKHSDSEKVHATEYCEIPVYGYGYGYGYPYGWGYGGGYISGRREVTFHTHTITHSLNAELSSPTNSLSFAKFEGAHTERETVYDFRGYCQR